MQIKKIRENKHWKIHYISHQLFDFKNLDTREKTTYFLVVLFAVASVGSVMGILVSIATLGISGFGLYRFLEKRWLKAPVKMEDVGTLVELQNSELYEQGQKIEGILKAQRDKLLNPDLSNSELQEIVETVQKALQ
ncbi:MAG: hypothetical protein JKY01_05560 [Pseudomonadales bacterium]|nr:hypothetical protein [Pseudomonadales bacterium]